MHISLAFLLSPVFFPCTFQRTARHAPTTFAKKAGENKASMKSKTTVQQIKERENSRQDREAMENQSAWVGNVALNLAGSFFFL